ncbi:MAG: response regulator [Acidobacteriota bacterium]|nr:response regulator [Acidobacteriota bacterium]
MQKRDFYTTFEISKICGVNPTTVQNWVKSNRLKAFQTPGGHRRVRHDDLLVFLREFGMPIPPGFEVEEAGSPSGAAPASRATPPTILIVDDEEDVRIVIEGALRTEREGIDVIQARNGIDALLAIGRVRPDMVILDIMMPGMNGFEVCRRLKASPDLQDLIIVGISGNLEPEVRERILRAGADVFFTKPLNLVDFRDECYRLLAI